MQKFIKRIFFSEMLVIFYEKYDIITLWSIFSTEISKESPASKRSEGGGGIASHLLTKSKKYEIVRI